MRGWIVVLVLTMAVAVDGCSNGSPQVRVGAPAEVDSPTFHVRFEPTSPKLARHDASAYDGGDSNGPDLLARTTTCLEHTYRITGQPVRPGRRLPPEGFVRFDQTTPQLDRVRTPDSVGFIAMVLPREATSFTDRSTTLRFATNGRLAVVEVPAGGKLSVLSDSIVVHYATGGRAALASHDS